MFWKNKNILRLLETLKDDLVGIEPHKYSKPKEDEKIREYHEEDFIGIFLVYRIWYIII